MRQKLSKCQIIKVYKLKWCGEVEITRMLSILDFKNIVFSIVNSYLLLESR